jgi:hypothetical protein
VNFGHHKKKKKEINKTIVLEGRVRNQEKEESTLYNES